MVSKIASLSLAGDLDWNGLVELRVSVQRLKSDLARLLVGHRGDLMLIDEPTNQRLIFTLFSGLQITP